MIKAIFFCSALLFSSAKFDTAFDLTRQTPSQLTISRDRCVFMKCRKGFICRNSKCIKANDIMINPIRPIQPRIDPIPLEPVQPKPNCPQPICPQGMSCIALYYPCNQLS